MVTMRRALASSLLLAALASVSLVCPCPAEMAAAMPDEHGCCRQEGFTAASSCCLTIADSEEPATLDAAPLLVLPLEVVGLAVPVVAVPAASVPRAATVNISPPAILRI